MPAYPLTYPAAVAFWPARVRVRRQRAQAIFDNEFTLEAQVQAFAAKRYAIEVELQRMDRTDAATFEIWLADLDGMVGTFNFDLSPWVRGSAPGTKVFKLSTPDDQWDADLAVDFGYAFSAFEVLS